MSFPPYFPKTPYLKSKVWHKVIRGLSVIFSFCSLYSAILMVILIIKGNLSLGAGFITNLLLIPLIIPAFPLVFVSPSSVAVALISSSHFTLFRTLVLPLAISGTENLILGKLLLLLYFLVLVFLPSLIYRFFLNQLLSDKWQPKRGKRK